MRRFGDFARRNLFERVEAFAGCVDGVHEMHVAVLDGILGPEAHT